MWGEEGKYKRGNEGKDCMRCATERVQKHKMGERKVREGGR